MTVGQQTNLFKSEVEAQAMKFEKRNFMGIELDVLVGHPEHDLLFVATQVARAAGQKAPSMAVQNFSHIKAGYKMQIGDLPLTNLVRDKRTCPSNAWLFDEARVYQMLLRGHSPKSEPFRKWVTEEVLPTIRKTGSYNAEQSTNPIAMGLMDELKALRGEVGELKAMIQGLNLTVATPASQSPYEGVTKGTVWYHIDKRGVREAGEVLKLSAVVADKLLPRVMIQLEMDLVKLWKESDGRALDAEFSAGTKRNWTCWPMDFLRAQLTRSRYIATITQVMNESLSK